MYRSLHVQLIAIVVGTVTVVLAISQGVDSHLTDRAIEQDLRSRAELALRAVDSLWSSSPPAELRDRLAAMVRGDREIKAIDIFRLRDSTADVDVTTREPGEIADASLDAEQIKQLSHRLPVLRELPEDGGASGWRISIPLMRRGSVLGAAQV